MKLIQDILYIEFDDMVATGVPEFTIKGAKRDGSKCWNFINDPSDKRKVLIQYSTLAPIYKEKVNSHFGNPFDFIKLQGLESIKPSIADREHYVSKGFISKKNIECYCIMAAFLRYIDTRNYKADGFTDKAAFYQASMAYINDKKVCGLKLNNTRVLLRKLKAFKENGLDSLISGKFNNDNSSKLCPEAKEFLENLQKLHHKLPYSTIYYLYSLEAVKKQWKEVTYQCMFTYLTQPEVQQRCEEARAGNASYRNKFAPVTNRLKPTYPNDLWVMDGTPFELYYREGDNFNKRVYVYDILDAYSWKVVGYAIGKTENAQLVYYAIRNACCTQGVIPHQILHDKGPGNMQKDIQELIGKIAHIHFPTRTGNARSKVIEAFTGHFNRTILKLYKNHSGGNITAKDEDTHANRDFLQKFKKEVIPDKEKLFAQIHEAMALWDSHRTPQVKGATKEQIPEILDFRTIEKTSRFPLLTLPSPNEKYATPSPRQYALTDTMRLDLFGLTRRLPVKYTNEGLPIVINGERRLYWVKDEDFYLKSVGASFDVKIDPERLDVVALYKNDTFIRLAEAKTLIPMARIDFKPGDGEELYEQLQFAENVHARVKTDYRELEMDAEGYLKAAISLDGNFKHTLNSAEDVVKRISSGNDYTESIYDGEATGGIVE